MKSNCTVGIDIGGTNFRIGGAYPAENLPIIFADDAEEKGVVGAARYAFSKA